MTHFVVIGLGSIGRRHAANLAELRPDARFTFVRRSSEHDEFSRALGASVVTDIGEVDDPVDLAVVATPSAQHVEALPTLIDHGWPLLVEKPIVATTSDCDAVEALLDAGPPAVRAAGFNLRHLPSLQRVRSIIANGELGRLVRASLVAGQWLPDWRPGADYRQSYSADTARGGGVELDLSHEFDMARWLFGELHVIGASGGHRSALEIAAHDTSVSVLSRSDGSGPDITVSVDYVSRRPVRRYDVVGDRASLTWSLDGTLDIVRTDGRSELPCGDQDFEMGGSYVRMMRATLDAIGMGDTNDIQSLRDGIGSSRLAIAVRDLGSRT